MSGVDRRALNVLLAALDIEQRELATRMGYRPGYVANVFNGFTPPSTEFKAAFGELVADLLLGESRRGCGSYPAGPLAELIEKRAAQACDRARFYADLGIARNGWNKRKLVTDALVDRVCCALGVHPSSIYPDYGFEEGP